MKVTNKIKLIALLLLFPIASLHVHAQESQVMSKGELVDMYVNMLEQASEYQKTAETTMEERLKEQLGEEKYATFKKESEARELAEKTEMANCMGISVDKVDSLVDDLGAEFQIKSVKQCSSELPEKVTLTDMSNMAANADLKGFADCIAATTAKKSGISEDKLKSCAQN